MSQPLSASAVELAGEIAGTEPIIEPPRRRASMRAVVGGFAGINLLVLILGTITGPLQARGLGPTGRGELAAIVVVMQELSIVATFGLVAYATREVARGTPPGEIVGSIGGLLVVVGLLIMPIGLPVSSLIGQGRAVVEHYVLVAFMVLPISLLGVLLSSLLGGLERWRLMAVTRLIPIVLPATVIVALYLSDSMTTGAVAAATLAAGILAIVPALVALRGWGSLRFRMSHVRKGVPFGLKSWGAYLAMLTNNRLDQLLMAGLASSRQLGWYAVGVTVASLPNVVVGAVGPPLLTRLCAGERHLLPRAFRACVATVLIASAGLALVSVVVIPALFGDAFRTAVPMAAILLFAAVPLAGVAVLSPAFIADGAPSYPAVGEWIAVAITVPGLIIVLPIWGGIGAAAVSAVAYSVNCVLQLMVARMRFGGRYSDYVRFRLTDLAPLGSAVARVLPWRRLRRLSAARSAS